MTIIDAHSHLPADHPELAAVFDELDMKVVNICVASGELGGLEAQRGWYSALAKEKPHRFAWCTSFHLDGFGTDGWARRCIEQIDHDLDAGGAVACKVWKNVGMDLRDPDTGAYVFVDDERFTPIFRHMAKRGRPMLMHIGEPLACWRPLDPESPHYGYYKHNPKWHWCDRTDVPTHEQLMAARDRVLERHPDLTVVGAHYGSHEYDVDEVASRLDRYPNYYVDTSARLGDIALQTARDREKVRRFFLRYADRVLWGIDWVFGKPASAMDDATRARHARDLRRVYDTERRFFATGDEVTIHNRPVRGLGLPEDVVRRLKGENAERVYRGV